MDSKALSQEQQQRLLRAQNGLRKTVEKCASELILGKESAFVKSACNGIETLSLAEATWLDQKQWSMTEKTLLLCHVDQHRHKTKKKLPLFRLAILGNLATVATATQYKGYKTIAGMSAVLAAATALDIAIDYVKEATIHKIIKNAINDSAQTNDNLRMGMRCLTPRTTYTH